MIATALVLDVVDGDTIDIRDDVRGRLRVRILGIDTPETKKPGYTAGCWGPEATEFAKSNMVGQRVGLVTDPTQDRTDRYGRTLAYLVRADGWDYSVEAARAGTAHSYVYDRPVSRHGAIQTAEIEARDAGRGLCGTPVNLLSNKCGGLRTRSAVFRFLTAAAVVAALTVSPVARGAHEDCDETLILYDPHDLVWDTDIPVDFSTLIEVEGLVDEYTQKVDDAPSTRWEIEDAIDLGRSLAGCED